MQTLYFSENGICQIEPSAISLTILDTQESCIGKTYDELLLLNNQALNAESAKLAKFLEAKASPSQGLQLRYCVTGNRAIFTARYICNAHDKLTPAKIATLAKDGGFDITIREMSLVTGIINECRFELCYAKSNSLKAEAIDEALQNKMLACAEASENLSFEIVDGKFLAWFYDDMPKAELLAIANSVDAQISFGNIRKYGTHNCCELLLKPKQALRAKADKQSYDGYRKIIAEALQGKHVPRQAKIDEWSALCEHDEIKLGKYVQGHIDYWQSKNNLS